MNTSMKRWGKLVLLSGLIAVPTAVAIPYMLALFESPPDTSGEPPIESFENHATPFYMPGVRTPATKSASEAFLPDNEPVIGITTAGHHRAYRILGMGGVMGHVVNDLLGDVPVTVTYCDRTDCSQVFTGEHSDEPLEVATGGWVGGLLLKIDKRYFLQSTNRFIDADNRGESVLPIMPHTRTTWKKWRDAYPDTDVYIGLNADPKP